MSDIRRTNYRQQKQNSSNFSSKNSGLQNRPVQSSESFNPNNSKNNSSVNLIGLAKKQGNSIQLQEIRHNNQPGSIENSQANNYNNNQPSWFSSTETNTQTNSYDETLAENNQDFEANFDDLDDFDLGDISTNQEDQKENDHQRNTEETTKADISLEEFEVLEKEIEENVEENLEEEDCQDGTHPDFAENLHEQLLQISEGFADPTPSCIIGDFEPSSSENFSGSHPVDLTFNGSQGNKSGVTDKSGNTASTVERNLFLQSRQNLKNIAETHVMSENQNYITSSVSSSQVGNRKNRQKRNNINDNNSAYTSQSKKSNLPAWMQASDEIEEVDNKENYPQPAARSIGGRSSKYNNDRKMLDSQRLNEQSSVVTGSSMKNSLPSWMQAAVDNNDIEDEFNEQDDLEMNNFDDGNLDETAKNIYCDKTSSKASNEYHSRTNNREAYSNSGFSGSMTASQARAYREKDYVTSQKSNDGSANWTQNRSYFLRMNKMREKDSTKGWTKGMKSTPKSNGPRLNELGRDATIRAMADELDEAKIQAKGQEEELENLNSQIQLLQENQIEEEVNRVEAEIARERAINENRQLAQDKSDLLAKLNNFEGLLKKQKEDMEAKISVEVEKRMVTEVKYQNVENDLMATKVSAKTIESRMHALDAVMMEQDYSQKILKLDAIILENSDQEDLRKSLELKKQELIEKEKEYESKINIPKSDSVMQTDSILDVSQVTLPNSSLNNNNIQERETSSDSSDSSSGSDYTDSADDEQTVMSNIHISRTLTNSSKSKSKIKKKQASKIDLLDIHRTKSQTQSLRRVQTMPVFKAESGYLTQVFTTCAANSAYFSIASKTLFGFLALTQENGFSNLFNLWYRKDDDKPSDSNKNARFFNSGVGQNTIDDFETRSRMSMNRRVQSMNFESQNNIEIGGEFLRDSNQNIYEEDEQNRKKGRKSKKSKKSK